MGWPDWITVIDTERQARSAIEESTAEHLHTEELDQRRREVVAQRISPAETDDPAAAASAAVPDPAPEEDEPETL